MLEISSRWLETVVDASVKSLLVAFVAGLAMAVLRVRDTNVRHRIWAGVLAGMLAMPLLVVWTRNVAPTVPLPDWMTVAWQVPSPGPESVATVRAVPSREETAVYEVDTLGGTFESDGALFAEEFGVPHDFARAAERAPHAPLPEETAAAVESAPVATASPFDEPPLTSATPPWLATHWPVLLASTYVALAAALLCRLAVGLVLTYRLVRGSRSVDPYASGSFEGGPNVRLLEHPQVFVPLTVGFFRPVILLPAAWRDWSREKLHAVLAHELAHVRRADWLVALVAELNRALYWFHPLAWFLRRRLSALAEQNCDDAVLEAHGDRAQYARYLLEVAAALAASGRRAHAPLQTTAMARVPSVETRIDAILDPGRPLARKLGAIGIAALLAIGIPAVILAAALQPASEEERSEPPAADTEAGAEAESPAKSAHGNESDESDEDESISHITGRVVGPDGKPVSGASVYAVWTFEEIAPYEYSHEVMARATCGSQGQFELRFSVEKPEDDRQSHGWKVTAFADGYGPAWITDADLSKNPAPTLRLVRDRPISGRVLDLEGAPLAGIRVRIRQVRPATDEQAVLDWIAEAKEKRSPKDLEAYFFNGSGQVTGRFPTEWSDGRQYHGEPALTGEAVTDEDGGFEIRGLGANRLAILELVGPSIAKSIIHVVTRPMDTLTARPVTNRGVHSAVYYGCDLEYVAIPTQPIVGTVTDADSGAPLAGISVQIGQFAGNKFSQDGFLVARTNEQGRYRLLGAPQGGGHEIEVVPAVEEPYFPTGKRLESAAGLGPVTCDFELKPGIWVRGQVTDGDSGEPIADATVQYLPFATNEHAEDYANYDPEIVASITSDRYRTSADGSFRVLAIPGGGILSTVLGGEGKDSYFRLSADQVAPHLRDENGKLKTYHPFSVTSVNALREVQLSDSSAAGEYNLRVTPGLTRRIKLTDGSGRPVTGVRVVGRVFPPRLESGVEDSDVEIVGLLPDEERAVVFIHPEKRMGKGLKLGPGAEMTVKLEPCAVVRGRVVNEDTEPMEGVLVEPNVDRRELTRGWIHDLVPTRSDKDGRFEVLLPPGLTYHVSHYSPPWGPNFSAKVDPKPGDIIDIGDVTHGTELDLNDTAAMTDYGQAAIPNASAQQQLSTLAAPDLPAGREPQAPLVYEGQVLTPDGRPAAGAGLFFVYWYSHQDASAERRLVGQTGPDGKFRFEITREQFHRTGDSVPPWQWASLVAVKEGYGLAWAHSLAFETTGGALAEMSDPGHPTAGDIERVKAIMKEQGGPLRLAADTPIRGTVVDTEGQPIAGAQVSLLEAYTGADDTLDAWLEAAAGPRAAFYSIREKAPKHLYGPIARALIPAVPTDGDGGFTIRGVGRERLVRLLVEAPRIEAADVYCRTRPGETIEIASGSMEERLAIHGPELTHVAVPSKPVTGVVRDKESGRPLADVTVSSHTNWMALGVGKMRRVGNDFSRATTDELGRYELSGLPRSESNPIIFTPTDTMPFLPVATTVNTSGSDVEPVVRDIELMGGVLVTGRITDMETGRGVSGQIIYLVAGESTNGQALPSVTGRDNARSDMNGYFEMVVPRQPGYLAFTAFDDTYEKRASRPADASPVGMALTFFYASGPRGPEYHALAKLDFDEDAESHDVEMQVVRGRMVTGIIIDLAGNPLVGGQYSGRNDSGQWRPISGGKFVVATYDPSRPRRLTFVHRERKLAGTYVLSGEVDGEVRVQLQPWGTLTGRIVDDQQNAVPNVLIASGSMGRMVMPSPSMSREQAPPVPLPPAESYAASHIVTDEDGRFTIEGLVPGERYDLYGMEQAGFEQRLEGDIAQGVVLEPGQTLDLGDVTPERPDLEALRRAADRRAEEASKAKSTKETDEETNSSNAGSSEGRRERSEPGDDTPPVVSPAPASPEQNRGTEVGSSPSNDEQTATVRGTVADPNGRPVAGARLFWPTVASPTPVPDDFGLEHVATTGADGKFTAELSFNNLPRPTGSLVAIADGYGLAWLEIARGEIRATVELRLVEDLPIRGQILDTEGTPVVGAEIQFVGVSASSQGSIEPLLSAWKREWQSASMKVDLRLHVPYLADVLKVQPTNAEGRFEIRGLGKERASWTQFTSPRTAATTVVMISRNGLDPAEYNRLASSGGFLSYRRQTPELHGPRPRIVVEPTKIIEGRVTRMESDEPIAGVVVHANAGYMASVLASTDEDGRYRLVGLPKRDDEILISFNPPSGGRLLPRTLAVEQSPGLAPMRYDVGLRDGVVVSGRVTDKKTGKGVMAGIRVAPLPENKYADQPGYDLYKRSRVMEGVDADGRFRFVTIPGPGVVIVQAYGTDIEIDGNPVKLYMKDRFSDEELERVTVREDGDWFISHGNGLESFQEAMKVVDIPADAEEFRCDLVVDPGRTLEVDIQDDEGRPLAGTVVCGMTQTWPITFNIDNPTCTIYALDPEEPRQVIFYHPERKLAATRAFRGDETGRPVVRLAATRTLVGRAVLQDGQPLAGASVELSWRDDTARELQRQLNMTKEAIYTDDDGRFRVEGVLPGIFRLAFQQGDKRYTTDSRWDDARAIAAVGLGPDEGEVDLGDIVVQVHGTSTSSPE